MKAERQHKERTSRVIQPAKGEDGHIVDNRPQSRNQTKMVRIIQAKENKIVFPNKHKSLEKPLQLMSLYHGTTIEAKDSIVDDGIDYSCGSGEFGQGFYTVFDKKQAEHISMYYWNKEKKWENGDTGTAVVKMNIDDNDWASLMVGQEATYNTKKEWFRDRIVTGDTIPVNPDIAITENKNEDWDYREVEGKADATDNAIMIGPIKDPQTPYLQVVFGEEFENIELNNDLTFEDAGLTHEAEDEIGLEETLIDEASSGLGSMAFEIGGYEAIVYFKKFALSTPKHQRAALLRKYFGGIQGVDVPETIITWLSNNGFTSTETEDKAGDIIYKYISDLH